MTACRRTQWNFALQRAAELAGDLNKPLVILEALSCNYPWASDRFHGFVIEGMVDNTAGTAGRNGVLYYPYLEDRPGQGRGLLTALGESACAVVTDDYPCFFLPRLAKAAASRLRVSLEAVDSNGILPMRATSRVFTTAHSFRIFLQKTLPDHWSTLPAADPLRGLNVPGLKALPGRVLQTWPPVSASELERGGVGTAGLPLDHGVGRVELRGGAVAGQRALENFLDRRLANYVELRNHPDEAAVSGLSPYLHFGHLSAHQVFHELVMGQGWFPERVAGRASGSREGWWGLSASSEAFLDQLITWRELGFNFCLHRDDYDRYDSLPTWARETLELHQADPRQYLYSPAELEAAASHDRLWNAAQNQLVRTGTMHNYLRMLWGKKILEWTPGPEAALEIMIELNNKYALDGRDPNSYSGIFWILGRYDRAWGPPRPVFGKVRYMSSANTARKVRLKEYLERFAP
jgi:deoxyribodipyrimidine photo-lyase